MNLSFHQAWDLEGVSLEPPPFGKGLLQSNASRERSREVGDQVLVASFELDPVVSEAVKLKISVS